MADLPATPLAADLARLPRSLRVKLLELHEEAAKFAEQADVRNFDDFRGAYGLLTLLAPVAGLSKGEAARKANSSPATFTRWLRAEDVGRPHPAHVKGLFDGLRIISSWGAREIEAWISSHRSKEVA